MRISDWSSDVCSSDLANCKKCNSLAIEKGLVFAGNLHHIDTALRNCRWGMGRSNVEAAAAWGNRGVCDGGPNGLHKECRRSSRPVEIGRASCRDSACQYV